MCIKGDEVANGLTASWICSLFVKLASWSARVWKGILGIRDLTKTRCGIRENAKYHDGIRDLTATREARFAKI